MSDTIATRVVIHATVTGRYRLPLRDDYWPGAVHLSFTSRGGDWKGLGGDQSTRARRWRYQHGTSMTVVFPKGTITMEHLNRMRRSRRTLTLAAVLAPAALLVPLLVGEMASANPSRREAARPTIVLLHGDWADASSWNAVIERLDRQGYTVVAPPNPLRGPSSDAPYVASFLKTIPGPIVLVAHSYGGFVITNAATGNPNVKALVYIDAFVPDTGQTLTDLAVGSCLDPNSAFNAVPGPGGVVDVYLRTEANPPYPGFAECFANGVDRKQVPLLEATQRPAAVNQFSEPSGEPAWKTIPSWSLIGTADHVITPDQQETMSKHAGAHISTVDAGHLSLVTRPDVVTRVIEKAVDATS